MPINSKIGKHIKPKPKQGWKPEGARPLPKPKPKPRQKIEKPSRRKTTWPPSDPVADYKDAQKNLAAKKKAYEDHLNKVSRGKYNDTMGKPAKTEKSKPKIDPAQRRAILDRIRKGKTPKTASPWDKPKRPPKRPPNRPPKAYR